MTKAVFWDRDGVLNRVLPSREDGLQNVGPLKFQDFKIMDGAAEVLDGIKTGGYLNIVVTNQPDISSKKISWEELNKMLVLLKKRVPAISAIYVCPHTAEANCHCRKPKPGMLMDAAKDYKVDLSASFMVGDTQKDIDAGKSAGAKTILFKTGYNSGVSGYDFIVNSLDEISALCP